tara:strand:+ start:12 stop:710 length:699 start_codon:yes stop_codon:yes gene_type:complete
MSIQKKLADIQQVLKAPKGQRNNFGKYDFRSCEDILKAVKPLLGDLSLTLSDELVFSGMLEDEIVAAGVTVKTQRVYIKATATLSNGADTITATAYAREASVKKGMDSSQLTGSTSSYARKYCLSGLFSIDSEADSDVTNKHNEDKTLMIDMTNDLDMSLEGMASQPAAQPVKRVSKKLVQDVVALVNSSQETNETSLLVEALGELDQNEKQVIWKQLTGNQQEFVRLTKEM